MGDRQVQGRQDFGWERYRVGKIHYRVDRIRIDLYGVDGILSLVGELDDFHMEDYVRSRKSGVEFCSSGPGQRGRSSRVPSEPQKSGEQNGSKHETTTATHEEPGTFLSKFEV